jgi:hypothetical protein
VKDDAVDAKHPDEAGEVRKVMVHRGEWLLIRAEEREGWEKDGRMTGEG